MLDGADLDGDVVSVLFNLGDVLFFCGVYGVGDEFLAFGQGCGGRDDLVVEFVEVHRFIPRFCCRFDCCFGFRCWSG